MRLHDEATSSTDWALQSLDAFTNSSIRRRKITFFRRRRTFLHSLFHDSVTGLGRGNEAGTSTRPVTRRVLILEGTGRFVALLLIPHGLRSLVFSGLSLCLSSLHRVTKFGKAKSIGSAKLVRRFD